MRLKFMSRSVLVLAFVALLAPGCKKDAPEHATGGASTSAPEGGATTEGAQAGGATTEGAQAGGAGGATDTESFPGVGEAPQIEVVSQGAEPRQALRYKVAAGHEEQMLMRMDMQMSMTMAGTPMPSTELPPMELTAALSVKEITPEGDIRYEFRFTDANVVDKPSVNPQVATAIRDSLRGVSTLKGEAVVSPRGVVKKAAIDVAGIENPQLRQMMENLQRSLDQMSVPLPEQPVGQGAEWRVKQSIEQSGLRLNQVSTMKVTQLEGDEVVLSVSVDQNAPPQAFTPPGMPAGAKAHVDKMQTTGRGTSKVDLRRLIPTSKLGMQTDMALSIEMGGQKQAMGTKMTADMTIQPK